MKIAPRRLDVRVEFRNTNSRYDHGVQSVAATIALPPGADAGEVLARVNDFIEASLSGVAGRVYVGHSARLSAEV